jgi:hypothetical protein
MNAAIRAVVRTGLEKGCEVFGVQHGYAGLIEGRFIPMGARDVGGIMQRGGTVLGSARCPEFKEYDGRGKAVRELGRMGIDGLVSLEETDRKLELIRYRRWVSRLSEWPRQSITTCTARMSPSG